jgi:hypothetical protein
LSPTSASHRRSIFDPPDNDFPEAEEPLSLDDIALSLDALSESPPSEASEVGSQDEAEDMITDRELSDAHHEMEGMIWGTVPKPKGMKVKCSSQLLSAPLSITGFGTFSRTGLCCLFPSRTSQAPPNGVLLLTRNTCVRTLPNRN